MKKLFGLGALGLAVVGGSVWAQQSDEPLPAKPNSSADSRAKPGPAKPPEAEGDYADTAPARASVDAQLPATASARADRKKSGPARPAGPAFGQAGPTPGQAYQVAPYNPPVNYSSPPSTYGYSLPVAGDTYNSNANIGWEVRTGPGGAQYYTPVTRSVWGTPAENPANTKEFRDAIQALRDAKTEEDKTEAREKLNSIVSKQLDEDFTEREKRLAELEAKTKQLRDQLQQRKQSKSEIQKMLVMLIENPQGGLGLPQSWLNVINQPAYPTFSTTPYSNYSPNTALPNPAYAPATNE